MRRSSLLVLVLALAACHKPAGEAGSCRKNDNTCVAFRAEEGTAGKRMCAGATWTPGDETCPTGSLGTCKRAEQAERLYAGPPNNFTVASAKTACEFKGGTFVEAK